MSFTFPDGYFDDSRSVLGKLGSVWNDWYGGAELLRDVISARLQIDRQTFADLEEAVLTLSRYTVPIYHQEMWHRLQYLESDMNSGESALWRFDTGYSFDSSGLYFDTPVSSGYNSFDKPSDLADVQYIADSMTAPAVIWVRGIDFIVDDTSGALVFRNDPFDSGFSYDYVYENGEITDKLVSLWLFRASFDKERIYRHYGYILGFESDSSENYRDAVNAVFDAIVGGTALEQVLGLVSAMAGIPLVRNDSETVQDVAQDRNHKLVITDKEVYQFNTTATITAAVGDTVYKGDSLVSDFELVELRRGALSSNVKAIVLGEGLLAPEFEHELVLQNSIQSVTTTGTGSATKLSFPITGHPLEVEYFWDTVHLRRLTYGSSLYELLDATATGVPTTINPAEFFAENILRNNFLIIRINQAGMSDEAVGMWPGFLIRKLMPPRSALLLIIEMSTLSDIAYNELDSEEDTFLAMPTLEEEIDSVEEDCLTGKLYTFTCQ